MAFSFSPKIVTDGLVLALDAANPSSYVSGSTVWRDLTANGNIGTLVNGPTFSSANGGSIVFDGVDDYVTSSLSCSKTNYSIDFWLYPLATINFNQAILFDGPPAWVSFTFHTTSTGGVYVGTTVDDSNGRITPWRNNVVVTNQWQNFTFTFESGAAKFYKNSILETSKNISISIVESFRSFRTESANINVINGRLGPIKIYSNKVLSPAEVLQNYNALKGRFNLT